jgi:4-amino-4-deoxy-L-arabinose transferase-like glycosyltransferase
MSRVTKAPPAARATSDARAAPPTFTSRLRGLIGRADLVLVAVVVIAAVLRFWDLGAQSLWYDEWLTTEATSGGLSDVFRHAANREGIPPTYFLLMWGWEGAFGDGETALRTFSALVGIATVPVAYAIAHELGQRRTVARVAALLVAVNPMLVWYSQEARPYSLLALLGALSVWTFARVRSRGQGDDFLVWGLVSAGAIAVHYFAVFLVLAEGVALLLIRKRQARRLLVACAPTVLVLAALAPFALEQHSHEPNRRWISDFALADRASEAGRSALVGPSAFDGRLWIVSVAIVALATILLIARGSRDERSAAGLTAGIGGAAVVMPLLAVVVGVDVFLGRYLIAAFVPLVVAVSIGLAVRRAAWIGGAAVAVLCGVSLVAVVAVARDPGRQKPDWRSVADVFETGSRNRLLLLNVHGNLASPLLSYAKDARPLDEGATATVDEIDVLVAEATGKPCNALVGRACALVFLGAPLPQPLASQFTLEGRHDLDQFTVERYRSRRPIPVTKPDLVSPGDLPGALALVSRD